MNHETPRDKDCIFCRIIAGELPCAMIAETDQSLAFLDIAPIIKGHTLVIPKGHYDPVTALPAEVLQDMILVAQRIAASQLNALKAEGVNLLQSNGACAGQVVPHAHIHVIPRYQQDGHSWSWRTTEYTDAAERDTIAGKLRC